MRIAAQPVFQRNMFFVVVDILRAYITGRHTEIDKFVGNQLIRNPSPENILPKFNLKMNWIDLFVIVVKDKPIKETTFDILLQK